MTDAQLTILLADVALLLVAARAIGRLARWLAQPAVLGEIVAGILVGPTLFGGAIAHAVFPTGIRPYLSALADVGLVLFMFVVGLEFDHRRLRGSRRLTSGIAAGAILLPLGLGALLSLYLARHHHPAHLPSFVLFVGVALSVTAFPVLARIITDQRMSHTLVGTIALSAAAVCDLAAWTLLAVVQASAGDGRHRWLVLLVIPLGAVLFLAVRPGLGWLLARGDPDRPLWSGQFALVLAGLLATAAATQLVGLHFVFGAFLYGLAMPRTVPAALRQDLRHRVEASTAMLLPVYFIVAGLNVDLSRIGSGGLIELGLIMATALVGKAGGTFLAARVQGLPNRLSGVLATLMNTRGLTELIALSVGLQIGVIDHRLYSLMVVMAVVTTAMSGPLLRLLHRDVVGSAPSPPARKEVARSSFT